MNTSLRHLLDARDHLTLALNGLERDAERIALENLADELDAFIENGANPTETDRDPGMGIDRDPDRVEVYGPTLPPYYSPNLKREVTPVGRVAEVKQGKSTSYAKVSYARGTIWAVVGDKPGYVQLDTDPDGYTVAVLSEASETEMR